MGEVIELSKYRLTRYDFDLVDDLGFTEEDFELLDYLCDRLNKDAGEVLNIAIRLQAYLLGYKNKNKPIDIF